MMEPFRQNRLFFLKILANSSQNVGACRQLIFVEQLRERFLKLVYSIPSKKNITGQSPDFKY